MSQPDDHLTILFESLACEPVPADAAFKRQLVDVLQDVYPTTTWWEQFIAAWRVSDSWLRWSWRGVGVVLLLIWAVILLRPSQRALLTVAQGPIHVTNSPGLLAPWQVRRQQSQTVDKQQTVSIKVGSNIALPDESEAVLDLFNGSRVALSAGTRMTLTQATPGSLWQAPNVQMHVETGEVLAHVNKLEGSQERFEITLPSAQISVRGTIFRVRVISATHTYVATDEGVVMVSLVDPDQPKLTIDVPAGYEVHAIVGQPLRLQRQSAIDVTTDMVPPATGTFSELPSTLTPPPVESTDDVNATSAPGTVAVLPSTLELATPATGAPTPYVTLPPTSTPLPTLAPSPSVSETTDTPAQDNEDDVEPVTPPVTVTQHVDIVITQRDMPDPTAADSTLTYVLDIVNQGTAPALNVIVTDTLPVEVSLITATDVISLEQPLVWMFGSLAPNEHRVLFVKTRVHSDVVGSFSNRVDVSSASPDVNVSNNHSVESTAVTQATDLGLTTISLPKQVGAGETLTGVLEYDNFGPAHAEAVTLVLHLPPELRFGGTVTATPALTFIPAGPSGAPGTLLIQNKRPVAWSLATMPAFSTGRVVFTMTATSSVTGEVACTLHITSTTVDMDRRNNSQYHNLILLPTANLDLALEPNVNEVINGGVITYTLHYANHGPWTAENVTLSHDASLGLTLHTPDDWEIPVLPTGASGSVIVTATVTTTVRHPVTYAASLHSTTYDPYVENNHQVVSTTVQIAGLDIASYFTPERIVPNMPFTYSIVLANTGNVTIPSQSLSLWGTLPPEISYQSVTNMVNISDQHILSWQNTAVSLAPGATLSLTFVPTSTTLALDTYPHWLAATAQFSGLSLRVTEAASIAIVAPSIAIGQTISQSALSAEGQRLITLTTFLTNTGPSPIEILPVRVAFTHTNLTFVGGRPFPDFVNSKGVLSWHNTLVLTDAIHMQALPVNAGHVITSTFLFTSSTDIPSNRAFNYNMYVHNAKDVYQNPVQAVGVEYLYLHNLHLPLVIQR